MKKKTLSAKQAAARLGVRVETIYAYVSRDVLSKTLAPDGRSSLFDAAEVDALARRGRPRKGARRVGTVEVSLASSLTRVTPGGQLAFRGSEMAELAEVATFEQVAELLWLGDRPARVRWAENPDEAALRTARTLPGACPPVERLAVVAAAMACSRPLRIDLRPETVSQHARALINTFVACLPRVDPDKGKEKGKARGLDVGRGVSRGVAADLWPRLSPLPGTRARIKALDTALLVLADHELATSTLAARVAASTRADPFLSVLAGLAAVSGSLHGRAPAGVHALLRAAQAATHPELAVTEALLDSPGILPGFGHPVYEVEDPRATILLSRVLAIARPSDRLVIESVQGAIQDQIAPKMNIDFAVGALGFAASMKPASTEAIFAIARTAGWVAHALEEYGEAPLRFRARAIYDGGSTG